MVKMSKEENELTKYQNKFGTLVYGGKKLNHVRIVVMLDLELLICNSQMKR